MHNIMQDNKISKKDKHKLIAELPIHTSDFDE
jgi:hypothetical protein